MTRFDEASLKAVKKMIKIKPTMLDFNTHKYVNGKKYFIRIWRAGI